MEFEDDDLSPYLKRITQEAKRHGINSFAALQRATGLSSNTFSRNGKDIEYLNQAKDNIALAQFFGKSVDWVLTGKDKENYTETEKDLLSIFQKLSTTEQEVILGLLRSRTLNK